jgi:membrane-associated protease RseP (regulator of RpoE activity)
MSSPQQSVDEVVLSEEATIPPPKYRPRFQRRVRLPVILFLLTMLSTFVAGATQWLPFAYLDFISEQRELVAISLRLSILQHWQEGLLYMACLLGMLLAHEMGHFLMTVRYGIPASFPYFLPFPLSPLGTFGAVIRMDSREADRKQMFDIGIAGPLAGLVVAIPLLLIGIRQLDLTRSLDSPVGDGAVFQLGMPLASRGLLALLHPPGYMGASHISVLHVNPFFMAGWVGLLVTGLNMMPVSQLDGGHITYCLFGRKAHWIARAFMVAAIGFMIYLSTYWMTIMLGLILLIGVDHPPTRNDQAPLGWFRYALGIGSLVIPILCLTIEPIVQ